MPEPFIPYAFPQPNMLVQQGTKVRIHDLQSEAGQKLNDKTGTALRFFPDGRWSVQVDGDGSTFKIMITNLAIVHADGESLYICIVSKDNPTWSASCEGGKVLVRAGTMGGAPALCIFDVPNRPGFDKKRFFEEISFMGITKASVEGFFEINNS